MMNRSALARSISMVGNVIEHYDNALFGLLAPFIAPLFFEKSDPLTALICTYGMLPLGILFRPLGSLFFGWIGDRYGRKQALVWSLMGMAAATVAMGSLPTYAIAGIYAPICLALCRIAQNFCAAGENVGAAIFILEHTPEHRKNFMSSIYNASTIVGTLIGSILVTFFSAHFKENTFWRFLFWSGGLTALIALPIRYTLLESEEYVSCRARWRPTWNQTIISNYKPLLAIVFAAGFSYTTYSLPFTFMNGYIPLVTSLTKVDAMKINSFLLLLDMCTLPLFGYLASRLPKEKIMFSSAVFTFLSSFPLLYMLPMASVAVLVLIRTLIVLCGVAFTATYYSWIQELVAPQCRYTILSTGHAIGSQLIGAPTSAVCLWLYQKTGWTGAPAFYLMLTAAMAAFAVSQSKKRTVYTTRRSAQGQSLGMSSAEIPK